MKRYFFSLFFVCLLPLSASLFAMDKTYLIDSGHESSIETLASTSRDNILISIDKEGISKIWDLKQNKLINEIYTGAQGNISLITHPYKSEFALLSTNTSESKIQVYNWENSTKLFSKTLNSTPIQLSYSGRGRFLFYTIIDTPSLIFLNSQTGRKLSYMNQNYDFFKFAYVGSTERTVMTYGNRGILKYWNIPTGALQNEIKTETNLQNIQILQNSGKRYILAQKGDSLLTIDRLSGQIRDQIQVQNLKTYHVDIAKGEIFYIENKGPNHYSLNLLKTDEGFFTPYSIKNWFSWETPISENETETETETESSFSFFTADIPVQLQSANKTLYLGFKSGEIFQLNNLKEGLTLFKKPTTQKILDFSLENDTLYILSKDEIKRVKSPLFSREMNPSVSQLNQFQIDSIFTQDHSVKHIKALDSNKLLLWSNSYYSTFDLEREKELIRHSDFESPIKQINTLDSKALILMENGNAKIKDIASGMEEFSFSALGLNSLNFIDDKTLLGGKSISTSRETSMFKLFTDTGEIIPIKDDRFLIYKIINPANSPYIYSIGLRKKSYAKSETLIRRFNKDNLSIKTDILKLEGEWIDAQLVIDSSNYSPTIFGTLDGKSILKKQSYRTSTWSYEKEVKTLKLYKSILYILNTDGSLTLMNSRTGTIIADFYLTDSGNWIGIPYSSDYIPVVSEKNDSSLINHFNKYSFTTIPTKTFHWQMN